jgi:short subunit dehydrogenase-like uncharacterized protein
MDDETCTELWLLGATGRIGRAVAERLAAEGSCTLVLVGRNEAGLRKLADGLPGHARVVVAESVSEMAGEIRHGHPAVVVNMVGSYAQTAAEIERACLARRAGYVDLANDLFAVSALLALHQEAIAAGSTMVTGAGFGVLATEAVVAALCADAPPPLSVRVDAIGSSASHAGVVGEAFAAATVDVLTTGGREFHDGVLTRTRLGAHPQRLNLPDGTAAASAALPSGELYAAKEASGAASVIATSALAPTSPVVRALLPVASTLLSRPTLGRFAVRRLACAKFKAAPRPRPHSWGHAIAEWPDGVRREGWLRADDAMDYTADAVAVIATRLAGPGGPAGAYTPAVAFGPQIAVDAGGTLTLQ